MVSLKSWEAGFQHTAARRRLPRWKTISNISSCFNTQPPEGGCKIPDRVVSIGYGFNTQPPEGGCNIARGND